MIELARDGSTTPQFDVSQTLPPQNVFLYIAQAPGHPSPGSLSELSSHWANIEGHLKKHDENFIKKYGNDMDTLLVFVSSISVCDI